MTYSPTFSVIIPLYNKEPYIERALKSIFSQDFDDFEVIVVDDGSTDGSASRVRSCFGGEKKLRVIEQSNAGEGGARNRGIAEMRGAIATFLDGDDEWLPNHLSLMAQLATAFPEAGWFATGFRSILPGTLTMETTLCALRPLVVSNYFQVATGTYIIQSSSVAVRKTLLECVGGFAVDEPIGADLEFYARLALQSPLAYEPSISSIYYCLIPHGAMMSARWERKPPLVVRTLELQEDSLLSSANNDAIRRYVDWMLLEHVFAGLSAGHGPGVLHLLGSSKTTNGVLIALVRYVIPSSMLHFLIRLRRRLRHSPSFGRTPKGQAVVRRFHRPVQVA